MTANAPIDFGTVQKSAGSTRYAYFELFEIIAQFWEPGRQYSENEYVRPSSVTGFSYQASGDGQSKAREPKWPGVLGQTVTDGSVTWTATAAGSNGINAVSSPSVEVSGAEGLTATGPSTQNGIATNSRVRVTLGGGVSGETYTVTLTFTSGGQTLKAVLVVQVV